MDRVTRKAILELLSSFTTDSERFKINFNQENQTGIDPLEKMLLQELRQLGRELESLFSDSAALQSVEFLLKDLTKTKQSKETAPAQADNCVLKQLVGEYLEEKSARSSPSSRHKFLSTEERAAGSVREFLRKLKSAESSPWTPSSSFHQQFLAENPPENLENNVEELASRIAQKLLQNQSFREKLAPADKITSTQKPQFLWTEDITPAGQLLRMAEPSSEAIQIPAISSSGEQSSEAEDSLNAQTTASESIKQSEQPLSQKAAPILTGAENKSLGDENDSSAGSDDVTRNWRDSRGKLAPQPLLEQSIQTETPPTKNPAAQIHRQIQTDQFVTVDRPIQTMQRARTTDEGSQTNPPQPTAPHTSKLGEEESASEKMDSQKKSEPPPSADQSTTTSEKPSEVRSASIWSLGEVSPSLIDQLDPPILQLPSPPRRVPTVFQLPPQDVSLGEVLSQSLPPVLETVSASPRKRRAVDDEDTLDEITEISKTD